MTITEFLLARYAEDEAAVAYEPVDLSPWVAHGEGVDARRLAECAAKRQLVELHGPKRQRSSHGGLYCDTCDAYEVMEGLWGGGDLYPCDTIRILASVYTDHPDYQPEWSA